MEKELNQESFAEVMKSNVPVLVDFWASWCGPCKMAAPIITRIAEEYGGKLSVGKVNVDENAALAAAYGIVSIPTVMLFTDGEVRERIVGVRSFDEYCDIIDKYI